MQPAAPDDLYARIRQYRAQHLATARQEVALFSQEVARGSYPAKCLGCIKCGLRFCRFWSNEFNCEQYQRDLVALQIEQLLGG